MKSRLLLASLAVCALGLTGCRFKGAESFYSATSPTENTLWKGDKFSAGGLADASGGLDTKTSYTRGAKNRTTDKPMPGYDEPSKGSGQQPGDFPNVNRAGYGQQNGPAFQPSASDVGVGTAANH